MKTALPCILFKPEPYVLSKKASPMRVKSGPLCPQKEPCSLLKRAIRSIKTSSIYAFETRPAFCLLFKKRALRSIKQSPICACENRPIYAFEKSPAIY